MKRSRPRPEDFTVGWICALPIDRVAAEQVLDELYEDTSSSAPYILGRIGDHDVVIRCLPAGSSGLSSATRAAAQLETDFPQIQVRFMVGIGGGVPSAVNDVRLGDVVVSRPHKGHSGIVQYDFGKARPNGQFEFTGYQNAPPQFLLEASGELEARTIKQTNRINEHLHLFDTLPGFGRAEAGQDVLFKAEYTHASSSPNCSSCDPQMVEARVPREDQTPVIHYGTIASGNQVIKDAITRDRRSSELGGVLCFEMEAAGLMNSFPCLVIRGICDYTDSHKNDSWHSYASAMAAACAKEILLLTPNVRTSNPSHSGPVPFVVSDRLHLESPRPEAGPAPQSRQEVLKSLAFTQIDSRLATIKTNHASTCEWLLSQREYKDWLDPSRISDHHGFFWLKGKPGTGKSTIMKFLFARAKSTLTDSGTKIISFFFNARGEQLERSVEGMYRSLLHQLLTQFPHLQFLLDPFTTQTVNSWSIHTTRDVFNRAIEILDKRRLICFVDALDECPEDEVRDMVESFEELGNTTSSTGIQFLVCFSSRHYPHISIEKTVELILETQEGHGEDLKRYINNKLGAKRSKKAPASIKERLLRKSSGIFLWAVLVVSLLNKAIDRNQIHRLSEILDALPADLEDLFVDIIQRDEEDLAHLVLCLQWISFAHRPLLPEELYFAVRIGQVGEEVIPWDQTEATQDMINDSVVSTSKGLAELTKSKQPTVQFIHESVREFLLHRGGFSKLEPSLAMKTAGLCHDKLKECCYAYVTNVVLPDTPRSPRPSEQPDCQQRSRSPIETLDIHHLLLPSTPPKISSRVLADMRIEATKKYPLLQYAVMQVFRHADAAESHGIRQAQFLETFHKSQWIQWDNFFQKFRSCRHWETASLLYLMAEQNLPNLICLELQRVPHMDIRGERFGFPSHVALHYGHEAALKALIAPHLLPGSLSGAESYDISESQKKDDEKDVKLILERGRVVSASPTRSLLFWAVSERLTTVVRLLLATGKVDIESADKDHATVIPDLANSGSESMLKLFLTMGREYSCWSDSSRLKILHISVRNGLSGIVKMILDARQVDANLTDRFGQTALHIAAHVGDPIAEFLLRLQYVDVNCKSTTLSTPLHCAAEAGHATTVKLLLKRPGIDVNAMDLFKDTPLYLAAQNGHEAVVKLLLTETTNLEVNAVNRYENTPLHIAVSQKHEAVVKLLLTGATNLEVNAMNKDKNTPLHLAAENGHQSVVKLLLTETTNLEINAVNGNKNTPLHIASMQGHKAIIDLLLDPGKADHNLKNSGGWNALHYAAAKGYGAVVKLFLDTDGNDATTTNNEGKTPLHLAAFWGHCDVVKLLLKAPNVDVNFADAEGRTPLHWVMSYERNDVTKILVESPHVNANPKDGGDPRLAVIKGRDSVVKQWM